MKKTDPIAVFDSGMGGLTVLKQLMKLMPNENFIFFGDSANNPYGTKSFDEIRELTIKNLDFLKEKGAKAIVIACNTATSVAAPYARKKYTDIPVIGIEPALKPAVIQGGHPTVIVMATPVTLTQKKFDDLAKRYQDQANIILLPCPKLVNMIENGVCEGPEIDGYLREKFFPFRYMNVNSVVLGCTHFPHVREAILRAFDGKVSIFDGGEGTARETRRRLEEIGMLNDQKEKGSLEMINSLNTEKIIEMSYYLLNR